jgi:hypothetical protein
MTLEKLNQNIRSLLRATEFYLEKRESSPLIRTSEPFEWLIKEHKRLTFYTFDTTDPKYRDPRGEMARYTEPSHFHDKYVELRTAIYEDLWETSISQDILCDVADELNRYEKEIQNSSIPNKDWVELQGTLNKIQTLYFDMKRSQGLSKLPSHKISFASKKLIEQTLENLKNIETQKSFLQALIEDVFDKETGSILDLSQFFKANYNIEDKDLTFAIHITHELISLFKNSTPEKLDSNIKEYINRLKDLPDSKSRINALFKTLHFLGLDDFQMKYCEPFNKVFPDIPLQEAPETIFSLALEDEDFLPPLPILLWNYPDSPSTSPFPKFEFLKKVNLSNISHLRNYHLSFVYVKSLKELVLPRVCNYSCLSSQSFKTIQKLHLTAINKEEFNAIPKRNLLEIKFSKDQDLTDFDLSGFKLDTSESNYFRYERILQKRPFYK